MKVVTDLCVTEGDDEAGQLTLTKTMPSVNIETILSRTGFRPAINGEPAIVQPPTPEEIRLLRTQLDPAGKYFPEREDIVTEAERQLAP